MQSKDAQNKPRGLATLSTLALWTKVVLGPKEFRFLFNELRNPDEFVELVDSHLEIQLAGIVPEPTS